MRPNIDRFTFGMIGGLFLDIFKSIFRAFGRFLGGVIAAGIVGAIGGGAVALFYGFPFFPWVIGGFVVCAILAAVLMVFVANDMY